MNDLNVPGRCFEFNKFFEEPHQYGPIKLIQIGELCCERGFEIEAHMQICTEISFILSGEGSFTADGKRFPVREGDIFINQKGEMHSIQSSDQQNLRFLYIGFEMDENLEDENLRLVLEFFTSSVKERIRRDRLDIMSLFQKMLSEIYNEAACSEEMITCYLMQVIIMTYRTFNSLPALKPIPFRNVNVVGSTVYGVIKYIDNNMPDIQSVRYIAENLGYSSVYLSHLFHRRTGRTLQSYINYKKMEKSLELMENGCYNITQIAMMLNFGTIQSFSKAFKRTFGMSPTAYQSKYAGGDVQSDKAE